jgi:hypothetical protein
MAAESPIALIYGSDGSSYIETSIRAGIAVPTGQPGFMALGSDGTNTRYIKVSSTGVVIVDGSAVTQPVSGTFWQATQPVSIAATVAVSGPLTDVQLRASAVPVSLASTTITGSVAVTGPLTDTQLRATPVPVSGTVTANAGTGTFAVSAASLPLPTGAATETTLAAINTKTPALGQAVMGSSVPVAIASNQSVLPINDNAGSLTVDSTQLPAALVSGRLDVNVGASTTIAVTGPLTDAQLRATAVPVADGGGSLTVDGSVSVSNFPATQPISAVSLPLPAGAATSALQTTGNTSLGNIDTKLPAALVGGRLDANVGAWLGSTTPTVGQKTMAASIPVVLASDQSLVLDTEGTKTNNGAVPGANNVGTLPAVATTTPPTYTTGNQVALSVDTGGLLRVTSSSTSSEEATYTVVATATAPANNKSMLSIYNPTGSGYVLKLREFYIRNAATTAVTGVVAAFQLHRFVSAGAPTGGTALTVVAHDSDDATPASMDARTGGTVSGEIATPLDLMRISTDEWGPGTADVESQQQAIANYLPARAKRDSLIKPFFARAGQGLHIKFATNSTAGLIDVVFVFTKV